jgi:hypothetical protein
MERIDQNCYIGEIARKAEYTLGVLLSKDRLQLCDHINSDRAISIFTHKNLGVTQAPNSSTLH